MQEEKRKIIRSLTYPAIFVIIIWLVWITGVVFRIDLSVYGLQPLAWKGLIGIVTSPLLHADLSHLAANSIPLFLLGGLLFYFYRELAWKVILLVWLLSGTWVWFLARGESIHIGASGIIYGMASFLFFSGIIRRETGLMVITLLVVFLYGGLIWGIFPRFFPNKPISWESHMMGLLAGGILAFYYRKTGPQRKVYEWENEDDEEEEDTPGSPGEPDNPDSPEKRDLN
jgi:membrane associated rhomboid family serine protease